MAENDRRARPISNGSLIADCPFHETGRQMLQLYPSPPRGS